MRAFLLFAVVFMTAGLAWAGENVSSAPVSLSLGGYMRWYGTYTSLFDQKGPNVIRRNTYNTFDVMGDAEIYIQGETNVSDDLKIGLTAQLNAGTQDRFIDVSNDYAFYADAQDGNAWDEVYLMIDGNFGRIFVGNVKNAAYQMSVTAPSVSTLGIQESDFDGITATLPVSTLPVYDYVGTKVSYISPNVNGFSVGVSLMPSNNTNGHDASVLKANRLDNAEIGVLLYEKEIEPYSVAGSVFYARYEPRNGEAGINFGAGLNFGAGNWKIGGSVMRALYHGLNNKTVGGKGVINGGHADMFDVGFTYDLGPAAAGVSYIAMTGENRDGVLRQSMTQLSVLYRLGAGVDLFTDTAYTTYHVGNNERSGVGVATGIDLSF